MNDTVVDFRTEPSRYKHWKLSFDGQIATLAMDVSEDGGLKPGYKLKLNSYDLGVDIELHDALNRIRFEHPEVRTVIVTSAKERIFCSGANIFMLGLSSHAWKVNFCKFTNETRNGIEDSSRHSGLKFLAACNGTTAGGGYELALSCDEIILVDDRSSAVSLPEVPLLGVLPGTGGLTRLTDKRKVRRDHADIFCTTPDGVKGTRAKEWRLVDHIVRTQEFGEFVKKRAVAMAEQSDRPANAKAVALTPLERTIDERGIHYRYVDVAFDRAARTATITVRGPENVRAASLMLSPINFGALPMVSGQSRLAARFYDDGAVLDGLREELGVAFSPAEAVSLGLVTDAPDALDWDDELRQAIESRVALSPDALTGMEANLRFGPFENQATRVFGRLSAWQNWIFIRPNATGEKGALKVYGSGAQPKFDWERV